MMLSEYLNESVKSNITIFIGTDREVKNVKVKETIKIPDGTYNGEITDVVERTEPYEYTDILVVLDDYETVTLKLGNPSALSVDADGKPTTGLTKTLFKFGFKVKVDQDVDVNSIRDHLVGTKVIAVIENEETKKGTFARIISMKPQADAANSNSATNCSLSLNPSPRQKQQLENPFMEDSFNLHDNQTTVEHFGWKPMRGERPVKKRRYNYVDVSQQSLERFKRRLKHGKKKRRISQITKRC